MNRDRIHIRAVAESHIYDWKASVVISYPGPFVAAHAEVTGRSGVLVNQDAPSPLGGGGQGGGDRGFGAGWVSRTKF